MSMFNEFETASLKKMSLKKVYYLSTCSTCKRIMSGLGELLTEFEKHDIKGMPLTDDQLNELRFLSGSYEALFSRKSMKFRSLGLSNRDLAEDDYRKLILEDYTFLKRPVFLVENRVFIGNSEKVVTELSNLLKSR